MKGQVLLCRDVYNLREAMLPDLYPLNGFTTVLSIEHSYGYIHLIPVHFPAIKVPTYEDMGILICLRELLNISK